MHYNYYYMRYVYYIVCMYDGYRYCCSYIWSFPVVPKWRNKLTVCRGRRRLQSRAWFQVSFNCNCEFQGECTKANGNEITYQGRCHLQWLCRSVVPVAAQLQLLLYFSADSRQLPFCSVAVAVAVSVVAVVVIVCTSNVQFQFGLQGSEPGRGVGRGVRVPSQMANNAKPFSPCWLTLSHMCEFTSPV